MGRVSLYEKNKTSILKHFKSSPFYFSTKDINHKLTKLKEKGLISESISFDMLLNDLINEGFYSCSIPIKEVYHTRYSFRRNFHPIRFAATLGGPKSFLSMTTALNFQGLSNYREELIFVSTELTKKDTKKSVLEQEDIDKAFRVSSPRITKNVGTYEGYHFILLSPKFSQNYEVTLHKGIRVSTINRVFVEMIINAHYFKTPENIIEIFKPIREQLDLDKIYKIINIFDYIYPYFQCAGFYLSQLGFKKEQLMNFKENVSKYDFYTIKNKDSYVYDEYWKMFY